MFRQPHCFMCGYLTGHAVTCPFYRAPRFYDDPAEPDNGPWLDEGGEG